MAPAGVSRDGDAHASDGLLPHVAIFPFMAKGHTIPLAHLAHLLVSRRLAAVTFFTTPGAAAFVRAALPEDAVVVELPFPQGTAGESVEGLASVSSFAAFAEAASALRPLFEEALAAMRPPASLLIADGFLYWTAASAAALGVPRVSFLGTSAFSHVIREACLRDMPRAAEAPVTDDGARDTSYYTVPEFPHVHFSLGDLPPLPIPMIALDAKMAVAVAGSRGVIMNTFHELESRYIEHWNRHVGVRPPRAFPIGPLCLARQSSLSSSLSSSSSLVDLHADQSSWMRWLDEKSAAGQLVVFIALGTLFTVSEPQLKEVTEGLEQAEVNFLWAVRPDNVDLGTGFEERVQGRGMVVRGWVNQQRILEHDCVRGFLSHCGWNSVLESVSAGVPLAVWPMEFDRPVNAKLVVDELKVGVRVWTSDGTLRVLVKSKEVKGAVRGLMVGKMGVSIAKKAAALATQAQRAMSTGGSSWKMVEEMISELCTHEN